jgi:hypothetical protein
MHRLHVKRIGIRDLVCYVYIVRVDDMKLHKRSYRSHYNITLRKID